jgi:8-oxo-dGTP diphosphatase
VTLARGCSDKATLASPETCATAHQPHRVAIRDGRAPSLGEPPEGETSLLLFVPCLRTQSRPFSRCGDSRGTQRQRGATRSKHHRSSNAPVNCDCAGCPSKPSDALSSFRGNKQEVIRMARLPYPRAAVSCILQSTQRRYLLIKRGKPPGVGEWSVPGGKLELGETSIAGALREIYEETGLPACALSMHPRPVTVSDVCTHDASGSLEYHYVIAQCFAWVAPEYEAQIIPGDDASDARWFAAEEIRAMPVCDAPYAVAAPSSTVDPCSHCYFVPLSDASRRTKPSLAVRRRSLV